MENDFTCEKYHSILCKEVPDFLRKYFNLGLLTRLDKIGLLCGTDWTPLFKNKFFYSRFNHSLGVALIIWNFTHDKKQSIAGLLHDVSTPAFSHVVDFKNGDALKQESTESLNENLILNDKSLKEKLALDGLVPSDVKNYHLFPIADNEMPGLSADRLEYMYPSGAALNSVWSLDEVKKNYSSIEILKNEKNELELGFIDEKEALLYTEKFCDISLILQHNEDKIAMQLLADILSCAIKNNLFSEDDLYLKSEEEIIYYFDDLLQQNVNENFSRLYKLFRYSEKIIRSDKEIENAYCINLQVKKRYVDPLVKISFNRSERISKINSKAQKIIQDFFAFKDSDFAGIKYF